MKKARTPIRLPDRFREMVVAKNLDPTAIAQHHIDLMVIYPLLRSWDKEEQAKIIKKVKVRMMDYQTSGRVWVDSTLLNINNFYTDALIKLTNEEGLSKKQEENKSICLLNRWKKVISLLVNYPREMTIAGGGTIYITFDYFLISLLCNLSIRRHVTNYMRYSTEMATQKRD